MRRLLAALLLTGLACRPAPDPIILATTTSVANSGLLDATLPAFERQTRLQVRSLPVGSGRALRMLADEQADVVISHAPQQEIEMLRDHADWWYRKIFFNDFLIAGPAADPGRVRDSSDALDAFRRIQQSSARFVSRGDQSGTHEREKLLASDAGVSFSPDRLLITGQGMAASLRVAAEMGAYTLTDRGTFEQLAPQVQLVELFRGDPRLLNTYAVIARPTSKDGGTFAAWLAEGAGRETVAAALASGALRGFTLWPAGRPRLHPDDTP